MTRRFHNKVALVTGAGGGMGAATARQLAREGARVAVVDINGDLAKRTAEEIRADGGEAISIITDISVAEQVADMVAQTTSGFGALHYAVNNAGTGIGAANIPDTENSEWERVVNIHVNGGFYCLKYEIPEILKSGGGAIVTIASMYGHIGFAGRAAISATKHAIIGLTRSAALEYAAQGIRINTLCPGVIDTPLVRTGNDHVEKLAPMVPAQRIGMPEDIAKVACFLLSDDAAYIHASEIQVDGGICH